VRGLLFAISISTLLCHSHLSMAAVARDQVKSDVEHTSLQYFLDNANPDTGLVRDSAENFVATPATNNIASMSSTGFSLSVITNAALRGMVTREFAESYALKVVKFSRDHVERRKGWFAHWVDWTSGARAWQCEFSTIDTALFMAGAMYAAQVFPGGELASIVHQLYLDMDFPDMLTDGGAQPNKLTVSMAYFPGEGYTAAQWDMYAEQKILLIMGLGHPLHPLPASTWLAWNRRAPNLPATSNIMGIDGALFIHQYSDLYIDFRGFRDQFPNYFANSVALSQFQRSLIQTPQKFKTLQKGFWAFSAGEAPNNSYRVYSALNYSSTVCLGCVTGSAMFLAQEVLDDVSEWINGSYHDQIWGRYGFTDSIDLDQNWFSQNVLGITVGPEFLSLANTTAETSIWNVFMTIPEIREGLKRAELASGGTPTQVLFPSLTSSY
jgi:hypothetical protein